MTNREKFIEAFGDNPQRHHITKSWWDEEYVPLQEPCEDAISRQAVLDGIDTYISKAQSTGTQDDFYSFAELVVKVLPPVKPQEPKRGLMNSVAANAKNNDDTEGFHGLDN